MAHAEDHDEKPKVPEWVRPPLAHCLKRLDDEVRFLHLSMRGLDQLTRLPKLLEVLHGVDAEVKLEAGDKISVDAIERAQDDARWVEREISGGVPLLHSHSLVALWGSLEVLCEDLTACWLLNTPAVWEQPQLRKLKVSVGQFQALDGGERVRFVVKELSRSLAVDLSTGVGRLAPLLDVCGLAPPMGSNLRRGLHELSQVRNVVVHCGGRADAKLLAECPWLPWRVGDTVVVSHDIYGWYSHAARRFAERVLNQVFIAFGNKGCTCPGMDEIEERPDAVAATKVV